MTPYVASVEAKPGLRPQRGPLPTPTEVYALRPLP
jgi:hypothetical protein